MSLYWSTTTQSLPHPISWRLSLIFSPHIWLSLPSGFFLSGFPTKTFHSPFVSPIHAFWFDHKLQRGQELRMYRISSHGQPMRGGPRAFALGTSCEVLTAPLCQNRLCYDPFNYIHAVLYTCAMIVHTRAHTHIYIYVGTCLPNSVTWYLRNL